MAMASEDDDDEPIDEETTERWEPLPPRDLSARSKEADQQKYIVRWLRAHPQQPLMLAPCNEAGKDFLHFNLMGRQKGAPDIYIEEPRHGYHGMRLELKRLGGKLSPAQERMLAAYRARNFKAVVCEGYEDAIKELKAYLKQ